MFYIRRLTYDQKVYFEKRNRRLIKHKYYSNRFSRKKISTKKAIHPTCRPKAPNILSLTENTEETLNYFNIFFGKVRSNTFGCSFYFDIKNVEVITIDAIMYMLAILRNIKGKKVLKYKFKGNMPINDSARKIFEESGFFTYVDSASYIFKPKSKSIQIKSGNNANPDPAAEICEFVNEKCNTPRQFTFALYEVIMELITNTCNHAYTNKALLHSAWYIYVEDFEDRIEFVFLDTGEGIPTTVAKKIPEKVLESFSLLKDSALIKSALMGENRTETKLNHRGYGLPRVVQACTSGKLSKMSIYSDTGFCGIFSDEQDIYNCYDFNEHMEGTLFRWEIKKTVRSE